MIFIAVGTPPSPDGSPDLRHVSAAARGIGEHYDGDFTVVVNKSTVPIGSGNWVDSTRARIVRKAPWQRSRTGISRWPLIPEFLREGTALHDSLYPDRVVIGSDDPPSLEVLYSLYRPILDQTFAPPPYLPRPGGDGRGAADFDRPGFGRADQVRRQRVSCLKISYINEIGQLAEKVGADITQVAKGIGLDARIGTRFLQAGIGWGGSCFGKDTSALVSTAGEYNLTHAHRRSGARDQPPPARARRGEAAGRTEDPEGPDHRPAGLGLQTQHRRSARSAGDRHRAQAGGARLQGEGARSGGDGAVSELEYPDLAVTSCGAAEEVADDVDALVLVTEWQQYRELDWEALAGRMRSKIVLDGRNALDRGRLGRFGFRYLGIAG